MCGTLLDDSRVRNQPTALDDNNILRVTSEDERVSILDKKENDGQVWYKLQTIKPSSTGWVRGDRFLLEKGCLEHKGQG